MIEFKDVSFCYEGEENQEKKAVVDITLSIKKGEFVVLAGGSGSGKTTLTRMINGLIPDCFAGNVTCGGTGSEPVTYCSDGRAGWKCISKSEEPVLSGQQLE